MSKTVRRVAFAGIVAFVVYPLSYAPIHRAVRGHDTVGVLDLPKPLFWGAYQPVDFLIDRTWVRSPLLRWSDVWGVGEQFRMASWDREYSRQFSQSLEQAPTIPRGLERPWE